MKRKLISFALAVVTTSTAFAQNPIIRNQYTADPTARVFNNRVYLFPSHDIISPTEPERKWFCMEDYHMFSSTDLCDWTDHGVILSQEQVPWGNPKGYSMWAPDCIEHEGKYYFYFPDGAKPAEGRRGGFGVGVAIADNLFMGKFVPQEKPIAGINGIDPCVLQASDGNNYIFWGMGGLVGAKLGKDMMSLDGEPVRFQFPGEGLKEGPFAFEYNGNYYLTYPSVFKNGGTEQLDYAMSKNPLGPYEYKGCFMKTHENGCWTNHHSIINFKGQWYLFYHHNDYSPSFDKNRSACIDSLFFNPDGTIQEVKPTLRGVGITDARKLVQIDRYSAIGGKAHIEYHDTLNYFQGWKTVMPKGGWVKYNRVDPKSASAQNVCIRVKTSAPSILKLELGKYVANLNIPSTMGKWDEVNIAVKPMPQGVSDLKLTNIGAASAEVDWISLSESPREQYFIKNFPAVSKPDEEGFIRRWMVLEPINKPNRSNTVFTDTYLRENFNKEYFAGQQTILPKNGDKVTVDGKSLAWHELEANRYNVKLFRFATQNELQEYGVLYWAVTQIDCPEEIKNVRLSAGSNSASMWWVNGKEELLLSGDRRMVKDDGTSPRFNLKKGKNIIRCAVINGPGMSDFCVRLIDEKGNPVKNFTIKP